MSSVSLFIVVGCLLCSKFAVAGRPQMWLGDDPPNCNAQPRDCDLYGFDYIRDDADPDCSSGRKVLCASPHPKLISAPTPAEQINVMTYNVWEIFLTWLKTGQRERTCRIPAVIAEDYPDVEVIGFQEVFLGGCWADRGVTFRDLLRQHGFKYTTKTVGKYWLPDETDFSPSDKISPQLINGGTFIASKYPILEEDMYIFEAAEFISMDRFSRKGVNYAKILKSEGGQSRVYHVFNTHLNSGGSNWKARLYQANEMRWFINSKVIREDEPVILSGDFNMNGKGDITHVHAMLGRLRATAPPVIGSLTTSHVRGSFLDYVLYSSTHLKPVAATQEVVTPRSKKPILICTFATHIGYVSPYSPDCLNTDEVSDLSDHYATIGRFYFSAT